MMDTIEAEIKEAVHRGYPTAKQRTPDADALRFAAEWLRAYDDTHDGGAQTAVAAQVAEWLDGQADAKDERELAKQHGVPVNRLRTKLAAITKAAERNMEVDSPEL